MQMIPQGKWDGKEEYTSSMATLDHLLNKISPKSKMPKPRIAIHGWHLWTFCDGERRGYSMMDTHNPPGNLILDEILRGFVLQWQISILSRGMHEIQF